MKDSKGTGSLPASLKAQLDGLRLKLRWTEGSRAIFSALGALLISWIVVFGSDRLWDTPQPLLVLFSLTGWAATAWVLALGYRLAISQPRYDENLAKTAQSRFPSLGDRMLGVIELCDPNKETSKHSAALREAAVAQVAEETARYDLGKAVDMRLAKRVGVAFAALASLATVCSTFMPQATGNALKRWANPFDPVPRYTFASLTSFPVEKFVARGEPFQILCTIDPESFWLPAEATLTNSEGKEFVASLNGSSYLFEFEGLLETESFHLKTGDASGQLEVTPLIRPSLKKIHAIIKYPDYLGYETEHREVTGSTITAPIGSSVTIEGLANRPLGQVVMFGENGQAMGEGSIDLNRFTLNLGKIENAKSNKLVWRDLHNLSCSGPRNLELIAKKDEPPKVDFPGVGNTMAIVETEIFEVRTEARDDFGIQDIALSWILQNTGAEEVEKVAREWNLESRSNRTAEGTHAFSPALLEAPAGSTIAIRARTTDWRKDAEPVFSRVIFAEIVSIEAHAELIRARMEDLLSKLSEIARLEENVLIETLKLEAMDPEKAGEESSKRKTEATAEKQEDLAKQLNSMSKEGMENLREAMKNPVFDEETLKEWSETMQSMKELSEGKMQEASQQLSQAASSQSQSERSESLSEAENKEREILEEIQKLQGEINERLDDLEAMTLAQRLRKIKRTEDDLGESLTKNLSETIGLRPNDLPEKQRMLSENHHERQLETHYDAKTLKGEISRYHERTGKPQYGQVSDEMEDTQAAEGLYGVAELISRNISLNATAKLSHWSVKFEEWAKMLEPDGGGEGGGEGGGGEGEDITEQLIALLRIRKGESDLRRHTRLLDEEKLEVAKELKERSNEDKLRIEKELKERSDELGKRQRDLMVDLTDVQIELAKEQLNPIFDDAHSSMADAAGKLEKQNSGKETVADETKAYDFVSDIVNLIIESQCQSASQSSSSSQSQATAAAMQFLLQQFGEGEQEGQGMGMSSFGGGSNQGGDTDSNPPIQRVGGGDRTPDERRSRKASGWSGGLPNEFRDALENYFREIEE